ncbi:hypothetical protein [Aquabacterium sp.]|uniref:hypothetical protein n=1 Tax=Aquabacterium sp. TaxID=1872578 RepID=UPI003D6CE594
MTQQRRNDEGFRNQSFGSDGQQQVGGRSNWDQQVGRQDQHSQYSGGGSQYGSAPSGGSLGNPYGNQYPQDQGQRFGQQVPERQWGPDSNQNRLPGGSDYYERQFTDHHGAAGDPYRSTAYFQNQQGWDPSEHQGRHRYGARGFGATGFGSGDYSGLGAFEVGSRSNPQFNQPHHDPHYQQWREEQLRSFDEDYRQWHQERYQNFSNDFNDWRSRRQGQGQGNGDIRASSGAAAGSEVGGDLSDQGKSSGSSKGGK